MRSEIVFGDRVFSNCDLIHVGFIIPKGSTGISGGTFYGLVCVLWDGYNEVHYHLKEKISLEKRQNEIIY